MTVKSNRRSEKDKKVDAELDEALEGTFPASDPPAMTEPSAAEPPAPKPSKRPSPEKQDEAPS